MIQVLGNRKDIAKRMQAMGQGLAGAGQMVDAMDTIMGGPRPIDVVKPKGAEGGPFGLGIITNLRKRIQGER